eukprot:TRINITY_DN19896_c0_g1_i1.p1 TRINITY_DN19896_c0_g1~~TRINITY_DN19896_c0_g1_i1.p1  ORF type:complete len:468 (+),score=126.06 TRINITY_DN19896_c0_g1_i1:135-1406(+)
MNEDEENAQFLIKEGDNAIFSVNNDKKFLFAQIKANGTINIRKSEYKLSPLIGQYYGTTWEVTKKEGLVLLKNDIIDFSSLSQNDAEASGEETRDNRNLVQDNNHQKLTQADVRDMKQQGLRGGEIIKALCENSVSFSDKTEFSQKKYLLKKQEKYCPTVKIVKTTGFALCKSYFAKHSISSDSMSVRPDTLAQILTLSNVCANSTVLIYDETKGSVVTGSVVERLNLKVNTSTRIICVYRDGQQLTHQCLRMFNFDLNVIKSSVHFLSLSELKSIQTFTSNEPNRISAVREILKNKVDSLLIVTRADVMPVWRLMWRHLKPSRSFVVYHPFLQPLAEASHEITESGEIVMGQVAETWVRDFQVSPFRTRPEMQMSGASGYVFSGVKVIGEESKSKGVKRKKSRGEEEKEEREKKKSKQEEGI